jgi:hypothetical protein
MARLGVASLAAAAIGSMPALARDVAVTNGSFEDPVVTTIPGHLTSTAGPFCFASACPSIPGWAFEGLGGLFQPNGSVFPPGAMHGTQVFFSDGRGAGDAIATQSFASTLYRPGTDYTLTVAVGNRAESFIPFGGGFLSLFAGSDPGNVVGSIDLAAIVAPSAGQFKDVVLSLSAAELEAAGALGQAIGIRMGGATVGQSIFDDVRLSAAAIPEPGTVALFWLGLLGLGVLRRGAAAPR